MRIDRAISVFLCGTAILQAASGHSPQCLDAQENSKDAPIVEVLERMRGIGGTKKWLWIRVCGNGKLEWEEPESGANKLSSSTLAADQVSRLRALLGSLDWKGLKWGTGSL